MNPPCHRCEKTVYSMDKLACLDKYWHKGCFNCEVCSQTLTMKNYKGYNKLPYCNTHYPATTSIEVADTPENLRLKSNTKKQSSVEYHKKFEAEKGHYTSITDDPEALRERKNQQMEEESMRKYGGKYKSPLMTEDMPEEGKNPEHHPRYSLPEHVPTSTGGPPGGPAVDLGGQRYIARFDYAAAIVEEVSFSKGDTIINVKVIGPGWMIGTIESTGVRGTFPTTHVE